MSPSDTLCIVVRPSDPDEDLRVHMATMKIVRENQAFKHVVCMLDGEAKGWKTPAASAFCRRLLGLGFASYLNPTTTFGPGMDPLEGGPADNRSCGTAEIHLIAKGGPFPVGPPCDSLLSEIDAVMIRQNEISDVEIGPFQMKPRPLLAPGQVSLIMPFPHDATNDEFRTATLTMEITRKNQGPDAAILVTIDGFDEDEREVWQIPECVALCERIAASPILTWLSISGAEFDPQAGLGAAEILLTATGRMKVGGTPVTPEFMRELHDLRASHLPPTSGGDFPW